MALSSVPAPNFSTAGGYTPGQVESTGGGYDPSTGTFASNSANSIGGSAAVTALNNIAPSFGGKAPSLATAGLSSLPSTIKVPTPPAALAGASIVNPKFVSPLADLVSKTATSVSQAISEKLNQIPTPGDLLGKLNLDSKIGQLSGGLTSGLNGLVGGSANGLVGAASSIMNGSVGTGLGGITNALSSGTSALGGLTNTISNAVGGAAGIGGALSSLQSAAGSISNITADITGSLNKLGAGSLAGGALSSLSKISAAAGQVNNILSMIRGKNIPSGGQMFSQSGTPIKLEPNAKNDWRVRINAQFTMFNSPMFKLLENTGGVVWPYLPQISISTKANYTQIDPVHSNQPFYAYKNSQVDEINITGEFTCETETDAAYWIAATTFFRTATKMFFGQGDKAGNPPIICHLYGYGSSIFDKVPVIIKSFSVDLTDDINYIKCNTFGTSTWVPVMSNITVTVSPIYNRTTLRKFDLQKFAQGKLVDPGVGFI